MFLLHNGSDDQGQDSYRDVDIKDIVPVHIIYQVSTDSRPERDRSGRSDGPEPQCRPPLFGREYIAHNSHADRKEHAASETFDHPPEDQLFDGR